MEEMANRKIELWKNVIETRQRGTFESVVE